MIFVFCMAALTAKERLDSKEGRGSDLEKADDRVPKKASITSTTSISVRPTSITPQQRQYNSIWRSIYVLGLYPFTIVLCWGFTSMLRLWFIFAHGDDFDDDNDDTMDSYTVGRVDTH